MLGNPNDLFSICSTKGRAESMRTGLVVAGVVVGLFGCASAPAPKDRVAMDERLIGIWQGERDAGGKCAFMAWKMVRDADGQFSIVFFSDKSRSTTWAKEQGRWWTDNGRLVLKTAGVKQPDVYTYQFLSSNSVRFVNVKRDPSADCQADYEFTDHKVQN